MHQKPSPRNQLHWHDLEGAHPNNIPSEIDQFEKDDLRKEQMEVPEYQLEFEDSGTEDERWTPLHSPYSSAWNRIPKAHATPKL